MNIATENVLGQFFEPVFRTLPQDEVDEYEALIDAGDILATLQAVVRRTLKHTKQ